MEATESLAVVLDGIGVEGEGGVVHVETGVGEEGIEDVLEVGIQGTQVVVAGGFKEPADGLERNEGEDAGGHLRL